VVDAAQAVLADLSLVHAGNGGVVQLQAGGHDQVIIGKAHAALGDHLVAFGIELSHPLGHQLNPLGHVFGGAGHHIVLRLDAGGHQGEAGLVEMLLAGVDQGDFGAFQQPGQVGGGSQAGGSGPGNDDPGAGSWFFGGPGGTGLQQQVPAPAAPRVRKPRRSSLAVSRSLITWRNSCSLLMVGCLQKDWRSGGPPVNKFTVFTDLIS